MTPGFHIENFGCRAARADGEAVSDRLRAAGLSAREPTLADVVVVNTCSVTAEADRAARAFIRRAHRLNPEARIVVTGCYAQRAPQELAGLDGVAAVVGNSHKALAPAIAMGLAQGTKSLPSIETPTPLVSVQSLMSASASDCAPIWVDDRFAHSFLDEAQLLPGAQTRPNLKIQEGCGNRCTFCVIPQTRGSSRSLPADAVLRQVEGFVAAGGNELVLSGINLGRWGRDLPAAENPGHSTTKFRAPSFRLFSAERVGDHEPQPSSNRESSGARGALAPEGSYRHTLPALVRRIFRETALPRLRLSSIEPMDWDADLIGLLHEFGGRRLARHAHLPLQSGSDAVLRRMHRRYRPWHYADKVGALIAAAGPDLTLGADVMVGFPGESDREFDQTLEFVRSLPFGYLHLFPFSPRPGTRGWTLHAQSPVPPAAVEERMAALRKLASEKSEAHRGRFAGRDMEAITLHTPPALQALGRTTALTENFLHVEIDVSVPANRLIRLRVTGLNADLTLQATVPQVHSWEYATSLLTV